MVRVPKEIQDRIFSLLPIDLRVELRVKPGRVNGFLALECVLLKQLWMKMNPYRLHHAFVRHDEYRHLAVVIWHPKKQEFVAFMRNITGRFAFYAELEQPERWFTLAWQTTMCGCGWEDDEAYTDALFEAAHEWLIRLYDMCDIAHVGPWTRYMQDEYPYYRFLPEEPEARPPFPDISLLEHVTMPLAF